MRKIKAFTLAEIAISLIIIMILSALAMNYIRPNTQKLKLFAYAGMANLQKANSGIISKYSSLVAVSANPSSCSAATYSVGCQSCSGSNCTACMSGFTIVEYSDAVIPRKVCQNNDTKTVSFNSIPSGYDGYCLRLADSFTVKGAPNCQTKSAGDATANFTFANGSTFQGLSTPWITPYTNSEIKYKNIVFDMDGQKGANKIWVDRVPLRVYSGGNLDGMVTSVDCTTGGDNYFFNGDTLISLSAANKNPYCKQGWSATGTRVEKNFLIDNEIISFDIFKSDPDRVEGGKVISSNIARMIIPDASIMLANCVAYGGRGMFHKKSCASFSTTDENAKDKAGYRIDPRCVTATLCKSCLQGGVNICPRKDDGNNVGSESECLTIRNKYNPQDIECFIQPHKPSAGAGFIMNGTLDGLDM